MFTDFVIVAVVAAIGVAIVYVLFASVATPTTKQVAASKAVAAATSPKTSPAPKAREASQPKQAKPSQKVTEAEQPADKKDSSKADNKEAAKKAKAAAEKKKKEEEEIEALIARELAGVNSGMGASKVEKTTLEDAREKNRNKGRKGAAAEDDAAAKAEFSEAQKLKERAHGFKIVQTKEEVVEKEKAKKVASPVAAGPVDGGFKAVRGRRGSPSGNAATTDRDEIERKLAQFFKGNGGRKNKDRDVEQPAATRTEKKKPVSETSGVTIKGNIQAAQPNIWADDREW